MHPDLLQAIILAAIVRMPEANKRQLTSSVPARRERAEELLATSIMVAVPQRTWRADRRQICAKTITLDL
jgi:hypothetical protein